MKILVISNHNPFIWSSASNNRFFSLAQGLQLNGCEIELLFLRGYISQKEFSQFKSSGKYEGFNYKYLYYYFQKNKYHRKFFKILYPKTFVAKKIRKQLKKNNYDYIWLRHSHCIIKIGLKLFKQDLSVNYFHDQSEYSWIGINNFNLHKKYLQKFLPNIDILSIMTNTLIQYYKQYVGRKTSIIHLSMTVDFSRFDIEKSNTKLKQFYIGYCGTMNFKKDGVDILVQAFIKIMNNFPDYYLYIAGPLIPKEDYNRIIEIINKYNAFKRIVFLGYMTKDEIPQFLKNASILALARPNSKQAEGGFPTKLGEYLATGNPVCVTNVGEIGNYLSHGVSAFIAEPDSIASFANILNEAIVSPNAHEIGKRGKVVAYENFNKDIQSKILSDFLTSRLK